MRLMGDQYRIKPGRGRIYQSNSPPSAWVSNEIMYDFGFVLGTLLTEAPVNYRLAVMYIEFENVADPEDDVVVPTVNRNNGIGYYNSLLSDPNRDYLRVPITAFGSESSSEDYEQPNRWTFLARTTGVEGVHGKPFANVNNSKVFGAAVVAAVDRDDPSQDIVIARFYVPGAEQQLKLATSQISADYQLTFV